MFYDSAWRRLDHVVRSVPPAAGSVEEVLLSFDSNWSTAHCAAAEQWVIGQLSQPVTAFVKAVVDSDASCFQRLRTRVLYKRLGNIKSVIAVGCFQGGPFGASSAGSYEPEVDGYAPNNYQVRVRVVGHPAAADFLLGVCFLYGPELPPYVDVSGIYPIAPPPPPSPTPPLPTAEEHALAVLLRAVYAAPDQDAPRVQVEAFWTARGDARGEFVQAQLAGDESRAAALLAAHGQSWTEGLPVLPEGRIYRRGFLTEARVACSRTELFTAVFNPAWNLLTHLDLRIGDTNLERKFLDLAALGSLQRLTGIDALTLENRKLPPRLTSARAHGKIFNCPDQIVELELEESYFELAGRLILKLPPQLTLFRIDTDHELRIEDLYAIRWLFAKPRPAHLVLSGSSPTEGGPWRFEIIGTQGSFHGDPRVFKQLRELDGFPADVLFSQA